jgi:hypothetical protein
MRESAKKSAIWLALGLMIGAFSAQVYHEVNSAEPKGTPAFWYSSIG